MIGVSRLSEEYLITSKVGQLHSREIKNLLPGDYTYRIVIKNPLEKKYRIIVIVTEEDDIREEYSIESDSLVFKKALFLKKVTKNAKGHLTIQLKQTEGELISVFFPVSPILNSTVVKEKLDFTPVVEAISISFNKERRKDDLYSTTIKQDFPADIEAGLKLITIEEAEQQLEYVVYNKLFIADGSSGFIKFKRKIYRKLVVSTYKRLAKNSVRKRYFVKFYRNYVNLNIISEGSMSSFSNRLQK